MMRPALELWLGLNLFEAEAGMEILGYERRKESCRMGFFKNWFDWIRVSFFLSLWVELETDH